MERLAEGLFAARIMDPDDCGSVVEALTHSTFWKPATVYNGTGSVRRPAYRDQDVIHAAGGGLILRGFGEWFLGAMRRLWGEAGEPPCGPPRVFQYQRTGPGGHFTWHRDSCASRPVAGVWILYLNAVEQGGATEFDIGDRIIAVNPNPGTVALFRGDIRHRGAPVIAGTKYALIAANAPADRACADPVHEPVLRGGDSNV